MKMYLENGDLQNHSLLKIELYKKFLKDFLPVFLNTRNVENIIVCEPFSGPGVHVDGTNGSPLEAYNISKSLSNGFSLKNISLWFNEKNKVSHDVLFKKLGNYSNVNISNKSANEYLNDLLTNKDFNASNSHRMVFIDPYGYSESSVAAYETLSKIFELKYTDIMYFIPISYVQRFISTDKKEADPVKKFIEWRKIDKDLKSTEDISNAIVESFRGENKYSYGVKLNAGKNDYFVFYIGSHILAADKFLKIKEDIDALSGYDGYELDLFGNTSMDRVFDDVCSSCEEFMIKLLKSGVKTNKDVYKFCIQMGFRTKVQNRVLQKLYKYDRISINYKGKKPKRTVFYLGWKYFKSTEPVRLIINWKG